MELEYFSINSIVNSNFLNKCDWASLLEILKKLSIQPSYDNFMRMRRSCLKNITKIHIVHFIATIGRTNG